MQREREIVMTNKRNSDMYRLYKEYQKTMKISKKARNKRQKMNRKIKENYNNPFRRKDYNDNKYDITLWNSMIRDLEDSMKMIEMYLDFDDRHYLHKEYDNTKKRILNQKSYEGEVPLETLYGESVLDTTEVIYEKELQEQIDGLLEEVLTERQRQVVKMYFCDNMTQEEIARELGIQKQNVSNYIQNSLEKLKKYIESNNNYLFLTEK